MRRPLTRGAVVASVCALALAGAAAELRLVGDAFVRPRTETLACDAETVRAKGWTMTFTFDADGLSAACPLVDIPGVMQARFRFAGTEPALDQLDNSFGNYLNFKTADGRCPVIEAAIPGASTLGIPLGALKNPKGEIQALGRAHLPAPAGHVLLYPTRLPGCVCVNMTNATGVDATDARSVTRAEIECRAQIEPIVAFLREFAPGYETCYALSSAQNVGIRESRHFRGVYTLTEEDIVEGRSFDDWIAVRNFFNFDIHNVGGAGLDPNGAQKRFQAKGSYQIPYRCCVPETLDGLLLAGRNISGTHKAHSNFRVMTICADVGYGAGTAAALAAKAGVRPRDVDVAAVQRVLRAAGFEP